MSVEPAEITREELAAQHLLRSVDIESIESLLRNCPLRELAPGEVLIEAGAPNRHLYLLLSGRLSVRLGSADAAPLVMIEAGESVGELSLIDHQPASANVRAEVDCRVLVVDEELLWLLVNTSHAVSSNLLFTLTKRMRFGNDVIYQDREQLKEYRFHATVDGLTGLFNRYWLNKMLPRQMERSRTAAEPLSLVMIDIDYFKQYNDRFGHIAGDHAICAVATSLRENLRPADMAARYGGEEFLVMLPNSDLTGAMVVAERLRAATERTHIAFDQGPELPTLTISLGISQMSKDHDRPTSLLATTDAALYRAKNAGRNQVAV